MKNLTKKAEFSELYVLNQYSALLYTKSITYAAIILKQTQSLWTDQEWPIPMTLNGGKVQKGLTLKVCYCQPLYSQLTKT